MSAQRNEHFKSLQGSLMIARIVDGKRTTIRELGNQTFLRSLFSGRVGMGMTTLLTLTAMFGAVRQIVPRVSYISMLDIWMLMCILFVFSCILEFTIVTSMIRRGFKMRAERLEITCRVLIPLVFIGFNGIYWPSLYLS